MESGKVYVVHNEWIQNPEAEDGTMTYKIGLTTASVDKRYYGLGLLMPGEFECDFAYEFDGVKYKNVEKMLHKVLNRSSVGGEWFDMDDDMLDGVRLICEIAGGKLVTEAVEEEAEDGMQVEIDPFLEKIVNRWNEASDMKAVGVWPLTRRIHIPELGSIGRGMVYYFSVGASRHITIGLRCCGSGKKYLAIYNLFQESLKLKGRIFDCVKQTKYRWAELRTTVPLTTGVDSVVEIMKSLIEATKERIISGWGKE